MLHFCSLIHTRYHCTTVSNDRTQLNFDTTKSLQFKKKKYCVQIKDILALFLNLVEDLQLTTVVNEHKHATQCQHQQNVTVQQISVTFKINCTFKHVYIY